MKLYSIVWREKGVVVTSVGWIITEDDEDLAMCANFQQIGDKIGVIQPLAIKKSQILEKVELTHNYKIENIH